MHRSRHTYVSAVLCNDDTKEYSWLSGALMSDGVCIDRNKDSACEFRLSSATLPPNVEGVALRNVREELTSRVDHIVYSVDE